MFDAVREEYPPLLTTAQVAELLHVGPRTVLAMAATGRLKASRIPGTRQYNFFRDDVIRVLAENMVVPGEGELEEEEAVEQPAPPARRRSRARG